MCNSKLNMDLTKSNVSNRYILCIDGDELKIIRFGLQQLAGSTTLVGTTDKIDDEIREYADLMVEKLEQQRKGVDNNENEEMQQV